MPETDANLVLKARDGDNQAFAELYDRYARMVRALCFREAKNLSEAQDLAQEVFLRAYDKLDKLRKVELFGPWITSMTKNVLREYRRGKFRDRHVLVGLEPVEEPQKPENNDPENRLEAIKAAMSKLNEQERMALDVYYMQNQDAQKATKILKVSRSTLYRLLASGKEKLEQYIRSQEEQE